jgi:predicted translin family RNA/ssDNA-binding protein
MLPNTLESEKKIKCAIILTRKCNERKRFMMKNNFNEMKNDYKELIYKMSEQKYKDNIISFFSKIETVSKQLSEYVKETINIISSLDICNYNNLYNALYNSTCKESLSELLIMKTDLQQYFKCNPSFSNINFPFISITDISILKIKANRYLLQLLETSTLLYITAFQSQKIWEPDKLKLKYYINDCCKHLFKMLKLYYKIDHFIKHIKNLCDLKKIDLLSL